MVLPGTGLQVGSVLAFSCSIDAMEWIGMADFEGDRNSFGEGWVAGAGEPFTSVRGRVLVGAARKGSAVMI